MLKLFKSPYLSTTIFPLIIFNILFKKINSISGTNSEVFSGNGVTPSNDLCPCDMTEGVCDNGCYCDRDCLDFLLSNDYFSSFLIDESSYTEKNIDSKLDYCDDYIESVDDLYNPLVLAFKILKRGFCLVNKKDREDEEDTEDYDKSLESYEIKTDSDNDNDNNYQFEELYGTENKFVSDISGVNNFDKLDISLPISLPNGLCLFHSYRVKKNIDYEVTCSYNKEKITVSALESEFSCSNKYYIIDKYYYIYDNNALTNSYLKKVEILYYNQPNGIVNPVINCFYRVNDDNDYIDLTTEVKFAFNENDFKLSGNPGYIKGKQIIFETKTDNENEAEIFSNGLIFPIENSESSSSSSNTISDGYFYYDNYMDNKVTFEDLILYGYKEGKYFSSFTDLIELRYTPFGNGKKLDNKINDIDINSGNYGNNGYNNFVLVGQYKDSGAVNNTQFQIHSLGDGHGQNFYIDGQNRIETYQCYKYFIIKFVKLETETEWYYARSPVIIKLPKNIMYPFKIGTSKYKE